MRIQPPSSVYQYTFHMAHCQRNSIDETDFKKWLESASICSEISSILWEGSEMYLPFLCPVIRQ